LEAAKEEKVRVEALMMMEAKRSIEEALDRDTNPNPNPNWRQKDP